MSVYLNSSLSFKSFEGCDFSEQNLSELFLVYEFDLNCKQG